MTLYEELLNHHVSLFQARLANLAQQRHDIERIDHLGTILRSADIAACTALSSTGEVYLRANGPTAAIAAALRRTGHTLATTSDCRTALILPPKQLEHALTITLIIEEDHHERTTH